MGCTVIDEDINSEQYYWEKVSEDATETRLTGIWWDWFGDGKGDIQGDISFEGLDALTSLCCQKNQITSIEVSHNTALKLLNIIGNPLTGLDVSNNPALLYLYLSDKRIIQNRNTVFII